MTRKSRRRVPEILWRVYGNRARPLADTIIDLIPCQNIQTEECRCRRRRCLRCSSDKENFLIRQDDPIHYRKLLRRCFVVVRKQAPPLLDFCPISRWSQREIVERVIEMSSYASSGQNVICARYNKYDQSSPVIELLTSSAWKLLLSRVGHDVMVYLLRHTSIFLPFPGRKHQQVAGPPLSAEQKEQLSVPINKRKREDRAQPSKKRQKCLPKDTSPVVISKTGGNAVQEQEAFDKEQVYSSTERVIRRKKRSRLYLKRRRKQKRVNLRTVYNETICVTSCTNGKTLAGNTETDCRSLQANGSRRPTDFAKQVKTKKRSMFNILETRTVIPANHVLNNLKVNCADSKFLMKLIFGDINAWSTASCHGKGNCPPASSCLYHSLLKSFKNLIGKVRSRHLKKLLDKHCPAAPFDLVSTNSNFQSEEGKNLDTQPNGSSKKRNKKEAEVADPGIEGMKPYCTKAQVVSFIWAVCRSMVPENLLGTNRQRRVLRRNIAWFVSRRRREKCTVRQLLHKVKPSDFPFFARKQICCMCKGLQLRDKSIRSIQHMLCSKWITWLFLDIVKKLVSTNFYVTESQCGRQNVYYYRKCSWNRLINQEINKSLDGYVHVDKAEAESRSGMLGLTKFRLLPKENGMRMVLNLSSSSRLHSFRDAHAVLKEIQLKEPDMLGSSVFDYDDVYRKLCPYLISLRSQSRNVPPLFFVVADVFKAFDSINQDKLLCIMRCVLKDTYVFNKYALVCRGKRSHWVTDVLVSTDKDTGHSRFTSGAPYRPLHHVLVDRGESHSISKRDIMVWLEKMLKNNFLQLGESFYVQKVGIPQGHKLSSLLCCLYHGHLERTLIYPFLEEAAKDVSVIDKDLTALPSCNLLRFIDDFLFVSTSKKQAASFFHRLQRGFPEYNCFMNESKFCLNFEVEGKSGSSTKRMYVGENGIAFIRWTGLLINPHTFEVQVDYTRYLNNHISSTFTVAWQGRPVRHLRRKLCAFLAPKCHPILFDANINSGSVVRLNVYQTFLLAAMKFHCYSYELSRFWKLHPKMHLKFITRSIRYMFRLIRRRMRSINTGSSFRPVLELYKEEVTWLGLHAFIQVVKKKQGCYRKLLMYLKSALAVHKLSRRNLSKEMEYATDKLHSSSLWNLRY